MGSRRFTLNIVLENLGTKWGPCGETIQFLENQGRDIIVRIISRIVDFFTINFEIWSDILKKVLRYLVFLLMHLIWKYVVLHLFSARNSFIFGWQKTNSAKI